MLSKSACLHMLFDVRRKHLQGIMLNEFDHVLHNGILSSMPYKITDCQFHEGDRPAAGEYLGQREHVSESGRSSQTRIGTHSPSSSHARSRSTALTILANSPTSSRAISTSNSSQDLDIPCGDPEDAADHVSSIAAPSDNEHAAPSASKPATYPFTMPAGTVIAEAAGSSRSLDVDTCTSLKQYEDQVGLPDAAMRESGRVDIDRLSTPTGYASFHPHSASPRRAAPRQPPTMDSFFRPWTLCVGDMIVPQFSLFGMD